MPVPLGAHFTYDFFVTNDQLRFGVPTTRINRAGNDETEWPDGLKVVRMADGRVKLGRQGAQLRNKPTIQQFQNGNNPTAHIIATFDDLRQT